MVEVRLFCVCRCWMVSIYASFRPTESLVVAVLGLCGTCYFELAWYLVTLVVWVVCYGILIATLLPAGRYFLYPLIFC